MPLSGEQPRIFCVNYSGHDRSELLGLTTLPESEAFVNLTEGRINVLTTDRLMFDMAYNLKDIRPIDYLLLSGPSIACVLAVTAALAKNGEVKVLLFTGMNHVIRSISWSNIQAILLRHMEQGGSSVGASMTPHYLRGYAVDSALGA